MKLLPEQSAAVASWVAAGDNLSTVQKKLHDELGISMTYMDVRFLVDDLNLELKDKPKKADPADVGAKVASPSPGPAASASPAAAPEGDLTAEDEAWDDAEPDALPPQPGGGVTVTVDAVTLLPGALASGEVVFSDGVKGKWVVDNYGRPGFTEISQPGYRPSPEDAQVFMRELDAALQKKGL